MNYAYECLNPDPEDSEDCGGIFEVVFRNPAGEEMFRDQTIDKCPLCAGPVKGLNEEEYEALMAEDEAAAEGGYV